MLSCLSMLIGMFAVQWLALARRGDPTQAVARHRQHKQSCIPPDADNAYCSHSKQSLTQHMSPGCTAAAAASRVMWGCLCD